jgi:hypothetical protein
MTSPTNPPLWQVMHEAQWQQQRPLFAIPRQCYAAEIRAIADWLVPEEECASKTREDWVMHVAQEHMKAGSASGARSARRGVRRLLLAEAKRAEEGE